MASDEKKILLVEDEKAIRDAVAAYLERENYIVRGVGDGQSAVEEFEKHSFDLVILDLMLPKLSGERVCRAIRETSNVPIIMLTAKGEVEDRIIGLELGADDYLIKPFSPRELVARVRALLRRALRPAQAAARIGFGDVELDLEQRRVTRDGTPVHLTPIEFRLLGLLATAAGRVVTQRQLLIGAWGPNHVEHAHYLRVYMAGLRRKLEPDPRLPVHILTEPGVGYRWASTASG